MDFFEYATKQKALLAGTVPSSFFELENSNRSLANKLKIVLDKIKAKLFKMKLNIRDKFIYKFMPKKVILVGTGGHAKVLVDICERMGKFKIVGCTSQDSEISRFCGYKIYGSDSNLEAIFAKGITSAILAVGDNKIRKKLAKMLKEIGFDVVTLIHPNSIVSKSARIGKGTCVMPGAVINADAKIGDCAIVNTNSNIDHDCVIGDYAHIAPGSSLAGNVSVGEGTLIGVGSSVKPGVKINKWSVVGVGSTVVRDLLKQKTYFGNPATERKA